MIEKVGIDTVKNLYRSVLLLLAVLFGLAGCDHNAQTSFSDIEPKESTIENSTLNEQIKYTEDDIWLRTFLKENWSIAYYLFRTYVDPSYGVKDCNDSSSNNKYRYTLQVNDNYRVPYDLVENTYFNNAEEYRSLCKKYFCSDASNVVIPYADIVDPENDYITIRGELDSNEPLLIEINGRLYHAAGGIGGEYIPLLDMAKVVTITDNEIVFSYPCYLYVPENVIVGKGVLKKEDGIWKFGWFYLSNPIEFLDIHNS